ncbi:MAG: DUF1330 domain-containing protein [Acidimicrobiales bacterium]
MSAYFVVNCTIKDQALLEEYIAGAGASLGVVPLELCAMDNESEVIEGTPAGSRTVLLKFASKEDFRKWYDSPEYQAVIGKRFAATEGFGILVNGM